MRRFRNGEDVRYLPLTDRKLRLRRVVPKLGERLLHCDHIDVDGQGLFQLACQDDLEGIVAKRKSDPYLPEHATWLKIRNKNYSQWVGREELFERERSSNPACDTYAQKTQPYSSILRELYQKNSQNHSRLNTVTIARKCVRQSSLAIGLTLGMLNT